MTTQLETIEIILEIVIINSSGTSSSKSNKNSNINTEDLTTQVSGTLG